MRKRYKITIWLIIIVILITLIYLFQKDFGPDRSIVWGATFSTKYVQELDLDEKEVYTRLIEDLKVKTIRLPIYWDELEPVQGRYNWARWDWFIEKAKMRGIEIMPVLGRRVPRWPECHEPLWLLGQSEQQKEQEILKLLEVEINHLKKFNNIKKWQIDNEPFADFFGKCPPSSAEFVNQEVNLVKKLDSRPVVITESGELSTWRQGARLANIIGTSMYRITWNKWWGYFMWPLPPAYYYYKAGLLMAEFKQVKQVINTELQVEPWITQRYMKDTPFSEQFHGMNLDQVRSNIKYAKKSGLQEVYLWGIEWWYWLGKKHNDWRFWELGQKVIRN